MNLHNHYNLSASHPNSEIISAHRIVISGTAGIPGRYGGFETLAENLVRYSVDQSINARLAVYCSGSFQHERHDSEFSTTQLRYIPLSANGIQSIFYDIWSLLSALWHRDNIILLLGVSGSVALPFVRLFSSVKIVTNIDGIEWRRDKWQGLAKHFLRWSESLAVRYSHEVIADNTAIARYIKDVYNVDSHLIAYGGDHAINVVAQPIKEYSLPTDYALSVCRIEPENNIHLILDAFCRQRLLALVFVGNWSKSLYGRELRKRYASERHLHLLDPIYDLGKLKTLRTDAVLYVHGHSAGGTNPSLVEAMHFGKAVLAFDCEFNRASTENKALFFKDTEQLQALITPDMFSIYTNVGLAMQAIAQRCYTWDIVAREYFDLLIKSEKI